MKLTFIFLFTVFTIQASALGHEPGKTCLPAITLSITTSNTTCQKANGKIIVQATGGVAPYDYTISGPFSPQPSGVFFNLPAGTYLVTATDAILQSASQSVTLTNLFSEPVVSVIGITKPTGCATHDGILTLNGSGGTAPYMYSLDNVNYQAGNSFTNLTAGGYNYAVKDANGCTSKLDFIINNIKVPENCALTVNGESANIGCDPFLVSLTLDGVTGGTPPYMYSKDGINYQASNQFGNLTEGLNTFWIKDANSLILLYSRSFFDNCTPAFLVTAVVQPAICGVNGIINISASDGTPPYQYSLDGINYQAGNQFTGLTPGNYTIRVRDAYNIITAKFVVVPNSCVSVSSIITASTCGNSNGKIEAQAVNGSPPYTYSLDGVNYNTVNIFTNLLAGNYTIYVKDAIGSIGTQQVTVNNIDGPMITLVDTTNSGCDDHSGKITVTVINGIAPYNYSLNGNAFQSSPVFSGLQSGSYTVTVKDANNCVDTKPADIPMNNSLPSVNLGIDTILCEGPSILLNAANSNASYLWQDGSTNSTYLVNQSGKYFVSVNKQGCTAKDTIEITFKLKPRFTLGPDRSVCLGNPLTLDPKINGTITYLWQDGTISPTYKVIQPGNYSVTITNDCGSTTDDIMVKAAVCELYVPNSFTPNGDGLNDIFKAGYGENVTSFHLQVFNRYGQMIFEARDQAKGWDGKYKGSEQPNGSYAWLIRYSTFTNNNLQSLTGSVLLIR